MADTFGNARQVVGASYATIYTAPGQSGGTQRSVLMTLNIANVDSAERTVDVQILDVSAANAATRLAKGFKIPAGGVVNVLTGKIILEAADVVQISCSSANAVEAHLSFLEIT